MLKSVLLALYYLIESIQAQKYEKKPYFELLYPSPIDVNHGAVRGPTNCEVQAWHPTLVRCPAQKPPDMQTRLDSIYCPAECQLFPDAGFSYLGERQPQAETFQR